MAEHARNRRLWRWGPGGLVAAFALSIALFGGSGYAEPNNVHAAVYQWAANHPGENVPVILQTTGDAASAGETVTANGGKVERNLDLISAVQAEVPANSVRQIAATHGISFVSLDAGIVSTDNGGNRFANNLISEFPNAVKAPDAWGAGDFGQGIGVAIVDTGVSSANNSDFITYGQQRVIANVVVSNGTTVTTDGYGHGTHIAGIIGSDGDLNHGKYVGVAPLANLINVKIANDLGMSSLGDLIAGLQWVYLNKTQYNIKVVNLSLHSSIAESYTTNPVDAAVEFLWKNGIFVVVASGNTGPVAGSVNFPPSNDPFVMTVGAFDDKGTDSTSDDAPASFSSAGTTQDGFKKPELLAPGVNIVSDTDTSSILYFQGLLAGKVVTPGPYLKLSGTSMAAGVMSGVAALVYQAHPTWTPGQVKCSLIVKARKLSGLNSAFSVPRAGDTVNLTTPSCDSDVGITPSRGLIGTPIVPMVAAIAYVLSQPDPFAAAAEIGLDPVAANLVTTSPADPSVALSIETVDWSAIKWEAVTWESIKWDLIKWDSIKWNSIKWESIKWDLIKWDSIKWDLIKWDSIKWDLIKWDSIKWDLIKWDSIKWDSIKWDVVKWASVQSATQFDSIKWDANVGFDAIVD